ncbi:MAG TPA: prephenate dehydrogenase/arogenate dehydrogenase family protein [Thermomicrobiales bacterium]|nr:prephenate dehydrogenase/arogenate dehydrogenase family protein [Thermomicrobiales bacterium]
MQKVTIVGLGLIGSSIGLGLRRWASNEGKRNAVLEVTGFDLDLDHQNYSKKIKAVDRAEWDMIKAVRDADLVVLAVPPLAVREVFESIAPHLKHNVVVTDTTSTKVQVMEWAATMLPSSAHFVGGHPMAGKAQSIEGAEADLFKDATWCIVPSVQADEAAVQTVLGMVSALGAEPMFVDPHEHDSFVGGISHLPFLLSIALMRTVSADPGWRDMKFLTAGGFRDVSRLAAGSPEMHRDITATNREAVTRWVDICIDELQHMRSLIAANSEEADETLLARFRDARDARADWATSERREGQLVQDTEGELSKASVSEQMSQMFVGGMFRRRPRMSGTNRDRPGRDRE